MDEKKSNKECKCHYEVIINGKDKGCGCSKKNGASQKNDQQNKSMQSPENERIDGHA
jgi:hypothetical protein